MHPRRGGWVLLALALTGWTAFAQKPVTGPGRDPDLPPAKATLTITAPLPREEFPQGAPIVLEATAIDPAGYIARVEFYAGEKQIGVSELNFIVAPEPGTPIHHRLEWTGAAPGSHSLVAYATPTAGDRIRSQAVPIRVRSTPLPTASLAIRRPATGDVFEIGQPIPIHATAIDPAGYIARVEFYAGEKQIGVSELNFIVAPEPGTPIHHRLEWTQAAPGTHHLVARALDTAGQRVESDPVHIVVGESPSPVVLALRAEDARAAEPDDAATLDTATFVISRVGGPTDIAVSIALDLEGTARNGIDYARLRPEALLPAGATEVRVVVVPLADTLREGEETVVVRLLPIPCIAIFPPPPWCYRIEGSGEASAVIADATAEGNLPPRVALTDPRNGTVVDAGTPVRLRALATDPDGQVRLLEILDGNHLLGRAEAGELTVAWTDAAVGLHKLVARATDNEGAVTTSSPVVVFVRDALERSFVRRGLPPAYLPGGTFEVRLIAQPPRNAAAWTVDETPPADWSVTEISDDGVFDPASGRVKFGPYLDPAPRDLHYRVTPPSSATGRHAFRGTSSLDGSSHPIAGQTTIEPAGEYHPADVTPQDRALVADEVTAYAAAWKRGRPWGESGQSIPLGYVTRAGYLWRSGETYRLDPQAGAPPECWVPLTDPVPPLAPDSTRALTPAGGGPRPTPVPAERRGAARWKPGAPEDVTLVITPPPGTQAVAVEERIPPGWHVVRVSDGGEFDAATGCLRWGLYLGDTARELSYRLAPPADTASTGSFRGTASFDGRTVPIQGVTDAGATDEATALRIVQTRRDPNGRMRLRLQAPPDQVFTIEASSNLRDWSEVNAAVFTGEELEVDDPAAQSGAPHRYYRLRPAGP